VEIAAQG